MLAEATNAQMQGRMEHFRMDSLPSLFGVTYLINLPERRDRLKSATKQLARVGWDIGSEGVQLFPARRYTDPAGFPTAPTRGCFQSHLDCLRRAEAAGCRSVLLLEDDIAISTSVPRLIPSIKTLLETQRWDFIYFGHSETGNFPLARRDTKDVRFDLWNDELRTTYFYGVSSRIFRKLIAHLELVASGRPGDQEMGPMPVDGAYNIFRRKNPDVRCLIANPKLGWQLSSRSDIAPPGTLDSFIVLRPMSGVLRSFKRIAKLWGS